MSSDAPKNKGLNAAAKETAKLSRDAFEWFKTEHARTAPNRERAEQTADQVAQAGLESQKKQNEVADDYNNYNKETYRPLEKRLVADAQAYDTPERQQQYADRAVADVSMQAAAQRQAAQRDLASYGVAPDSAKSMSLLGSGDLNTTKAAAAAATGARDRVEATGYARMADAANLGRNLPSAQATAVSTGTQAGAGAVNASGASLNATNSGAGLMSTGFNTAIQGQQAAGNLYGKAASLSTQGADLGGIGQLAQGAAALKVFSDENIKSGVSMTNTGKALDEITATPVKDWHYDAAKGGPDDGEQPHTGPMAQMVNQTMGDKAAPGGKVIDLVTMNGKLMAGVQELAKKVKKLEGRKAA